MSSEADQWKDCGLSPERIELWKLITSDVAEQMHYVGAKTLIIELAENGKYTFQLDPKTLVEMKPEERLPGKEVWERWLNPLCKTLHQALEKLNAPGTVKRALTDGGDLGHVAWWISTLPATESEGGEG